MMAPRTSRCPSLVLVGLLVVVAVDCKPLSKDGHGHNHGLHKTIRGAENLEDVEVEARVLEHDVAELVGAGATALEETQVSVMEKGSSSSPVGEATVIERGEYKLKAVFGSKDGGKTFEMLEHYQLDKLGQPINFKLFTVPESDADPPNPPKWKEHLALPITGNANAAMRHRFKEFEGQVHNAESAWLSAYKEYLFDVEGPEIPLSYNVDRKQFPVGTINGGSLNGYGTELRFCEAHVINQVTSWLDINPNNKYYVLASEATTTKKKKKK